MTYIRLVDVVMVKLLEAYSGTGYCLCVLVHKRSILFAPNEVEYGIVNDVKVDMNVLCAPLFIACRYKRHQDNHHIIIWVILSVWCSLSPARCC